MHFPHRVIYFFYHHTITESFRIIFRIESLVIFTFSRKILRSDRKFWRLNTSVCPTWARKHSINKFSDSSFSARAESNRSARLPLILAADADPSGFYLRILCKSGSLLNNVIIIFSRRYRMAVEGSVDIIAS